MEDYNIFDIGYSKTLDRSGTATVLDSALPNLEETPSVGSYTGGLGNLTEGSVDPTSIDSGTLSNLLFSRKTTFTDTTAGYRMGVDTDGIYKWIIGNGTSSADWAVTTAATFTIVGTITASAGSIGGFTIGADFIRDAANSMGLASTVTGGDDVRFWAGDTFANRATAPFRVTETGVITASSGTIGGFTLGTSTISATNLTLTSGAANTANITVGTGSTAGGLNSANVGADIVFWAGNTFANRATAPFRVTAAGDVTGTSVTVQNATEQTTGTSGEAITAGQGVYLAAADTRLYRTIGTGDESTFSFVGVALTTVAGAGLTVNYARVGTIANAGLALTAGSYYFISDTAGTLATTPGTRFARVGIAISATQLLVLPPKFIVRGTQNITSATTFVQTTGFYPAHIEVRCGAAGVGGRIMGISVGDDTNNCVYQYPGTTINGNAAFDATKAWRVQDDLNAATRNAGTIITKTATGFTLNGVTYNSDATVQWVAYSE